jgi:adenosylcobinamide kinase / adenosylcobinamide-phosphate guanylyltransferase
VSREAEERSKKITLVLGGAQSGKSHYAQQLASHFERVTFIATARRTDAEMRKKIARHRRERPVAWKTIEADLQLEKAIYLASRESDVVLIDCLTVYMANVMRAGKKSKINPREHMQAVCGAIRASKADIIVVSNEVGSGVVPPYQSGRIYRDLLGQMNQEIAQVADDVVLMIAGVPLTLKEVRISEKKRIGDDSSIGLSAGRLMVPANGSHKRHSRS